MTAGEGIAAGELPNLFIDKMFHHFGVSYSNHLNQKVCIKFSISLK